MLSRVLIACEHFGANGGAGAHAVNSAAALAASGVEVRVLAGDVDPLHGGKALDIPGLAGRPALPEAAAELLAAIDAFQPEVVHVHDLHDTTLLRAVRAAAPLVWSVHNFIGCSTGNKYFRSGSVCTRAHGPGCIGNWFGRGCMHSLDPRPMPGRYRLISDLLGGLREADCAVAHSHYMAAHLARNDVQRVEVVPYFVEPRATARAADHASVLFVGRVSKLKGLSVLIDAMKDVDARLRVIGDGWYLPDVRRQAEKRGVAGRTSFEGWKSPVDLAKAYTSAAVLAVPSLWPEPFGIVGIEAAAHERPVVGSAVGGIPEWLEDRKNGRLVPAGDPRPLADALNEVLASASTSEAYGSAGRAIVEERFSPASYLAAIEVAYDRATEYWRRG